MPGLCGDHGAWTDRSAGRSDRRGGRAEAADRGDQARRGTPPQVLLIVFGCRKCCWEFCWEFGNFQTLTQTFKLSPKLSPKNQTLTQKPKTINKTTFIDRFDRFIDRFEVLLIVLGFWVRVWNFGRFG